MEKEIIANLVDKVLDIKSKTNHYVYLEINSNTYDITLRIIEGGWEQSRPYDLDETYESGNYSIIRWNRMLDYLDSLIPRMPIPKKVVKPWVE